MYKIFHTGGPLPTSFPALTLQWLIHSPAQNAFFTPEGRWDPELHSAARFGDHGLAQAAVRSSQLKDVELYYLFGGATPSVYDFAIRSNSSGSECGRPVSSK
jgi:hypothetical protein